MGSGRSDPAQDAVVSLGKVWQLLLFALQGGRGEEAELATCEKLGYPGPPWCEEAHGETTWNVTWESCQPGTRGWLPQPNTSLLALWVSHPGRCGGEYHAGLTKS